MPMPELLRRFWVAVLNMAVTPLGINLVYFAACSIAGWGLLSALKVRAPNRTPRGIDMLFTAVSAATVSHMSTVEMEVFSTAQLIVLTVLMLLGGEVFLSMVGLWLVRLREHGATRGEAVLLLPGADAPNDGYHLVPSSTEDDLAETSRSREEHEHPHREAEDQAETSTSREEHEHPHREAEEHEHPHPPPPSPSAVAVVAAAVTAYFLFAHVIGVVAVAASIHAAPGARQTLARKALGLWTFAVVTTVSTFANCGYVPTNENMVVFARDVPLQMLLAAMTLVGNTLFPLRLAPCVRAARWLMARWREEYSVVVVTRETTGYEHLLPPLRCRMLVVTVAVFVAVQAVLLCAMEWDGALQGLSAWEKVMNAIFVAVNSRHTGETTIDLSTVAPAVLVLFVLMMYLPSYTTWFPFGENSAEPPHRMTWLERASLSQLSYLTIAVIAICFTERRKLKDDPLNFNVFSVVVEVVSAYGNVGFSMGYSCSKQINPDQLCTDKWTGFVGRWSDCGKVILIIVMFFGRLKKFSMEGGKAWKLS